MLAYSTKTKHAIQNLSLRRPYGLKASTAPCDDAYHHDRKGPIYSLVAGHTREFIITSRGCTPDTRYTFNHGAIAYHDVARPHPLMQIMPSMSCVYGIPSVTLIIEIYLTKKPSQTQTFVSRLSKLVGC